LKTNTISVELAGVRPLMFARYPGDNHTQLPTAEKLYLDRDRRLIFPAINLYSLMCAENTKSVCKLLMGKQGKTIGLGIASFTTITPHEIPILRDGEQLTLDDYGKHIHEHKSVARLAKGIPSPQARPLITLPWAINFEMTYVENKFCTISNLRQVLELGSILGIGTFRPFYGRYLLNRFDVMD
jgi:hypothetical protein